uniref:Uncharacterized protein n=1 Tax=Physcomitrium patens TaxID=3218 RepID=A0A2K1K2V5_PHYPA|nr:hypothetical protein PHYPA_012577 [Physcomitrium patens]
MGKENRKKRWSTRFFQVMWVFLSSFVHFFFFFFFFSVCSFLCLQIYLILFCVFALLVQCILKETQ